MSYQIMLILHHYLAIALWWSDLNVGPNEILGFCYNCKSTGGTRRRRAMPFQFIPTVTALIFWSFKLFCSFETHLGFFFFPLLFLPGTQNYSGQSVFSVSPTEGTIYPFETQDITVIFQPDHESLHYRDALLVQLMNHVRGHQSVRHLQQTDQK